MAARSKNPAQPDAAVKSADQEATAPVTTGDATKDIQLYVAPEAGTAEPAKKNLAAVRMMTKSFGFAKPSGAKGIARQVADEAKPSQKPGAGGSGRPRRRGASKGR